VHLCADCALITESDESNNIAMADEKKAMAEFSQAL
jgi:hypothetical protein